jgi:hypothetical protein
MSQNGARTTAEYGRHPSPRLSELRPPNRVDAAPDWVKSADGDPVLNLVGPEACGKELAARNDPVLGGRQLPGTPIRPVDPFLAYEQKRVQNPAFAPLASNGRRAAISFHCSPGECMLFVSLRSQPG